MKYCCRSANARIWKSIVIATMRTMTRSSSEIIASRSVKPRTRRRLLDELGHIIHSLAAAGRADSEIARGGGVVRRHRRDRDHPNDAAALQRLGRVVHDRVTDLVGAFRRFHHVRSRGTPERPLGLASEVREIHGDLPERGDAGAEGRRQAVLRHVVVPADVLDDLLALEEHLRAGRRALVGDERNGEHLEDAYEDERHDRHGKEHLDEAAAAAGASARPTIARDATFSHSGSPRRNSGPGSAKWRSASSRARSIPD